MIAENKPHFFSEGTGPAEQIRYQGTYEIVPGVECETYVFQKTGAKDLAMIHVPPDHQTPRQRVVSGDRTVEHFMSGEGRLVVQTEGQPDAVHEFARGSEPAGVEVQVGQTMQWFAGKAGLVFAEVCWPPYQDGRFENLPD